MADISSDYTIQALGDYDISGIVPGLNYLLTLKTTVPTEGTATISFNNGPAGAFAEVDEPELLGATGISERRFQAPSPRMRISLDASFEEPIKVTIVESKP